MKIINIKNKIIIPSSKSHVHRLILALFLLEKKAKIKYSGSLSQDMIATINFVNTLFNSISYDDSYIYIEGFKLADIDRNKVYKIDVCESGSTLRFIMPIIAALSLNVEIVAYGRLLQRPHDELINSLAKAGYNFYIEKDKMYGSGKICNTDITIAADISSQYISGYIFAMLVNNDLNLKLSAEIVSVAYINMTLDVLDSLGVSYHFSDNRIKLDSIQEFLAEEILAEGDWSSAASIITLAIALNKDISIDNLSYISKQADISVLKAIEKAGVNYYIKNDLLHIKSHEGKIEGIEFSVDENPDLAPVLAAMLIAAKSTSKLTKVHRLRDKESDRLLEICKMFDKINVEYEQSGDDLIIKAFNGKAVELLTYDGSDHRMLMAYCVIAAYLKCELKILNPECVYKSYVNYYDNLILEN